MAGRCMMIRKDPKPPSPPSGERTKENLKREGEINGLETHS